MYKRILKTVLAYRDINKDVLSNEQMREIEEQLTWLSDMIAADGDEIEDDYDKEREMALKELFALFRGVRDNYTLIDFDGKYNIKENLEYGFEETPVYGFETDSLIFKIWNSCDPTHNFPHSEAVDMVEQQLLDDSECDEGSFNCGFWSDEIMWEIIWK